MTLEGNFIAKIACHSKAIYKYFLAPVGLLFYPKRFLSFWHYFSHTYNSASQSIKNTILRDEYNSTTAIMNKIVFIAGANDYHVAPSLLENFKHQVIPKMGHNFFGFEEEIAQIINNYEENNE